MTEQKLTGRREATHGLVYSSTSGTPPPPGLLRSAAQTVDPHRARMKRKKCGTITAARLMQEEMQAGGHRYRVAMLTLTYALTGIWRPRHISALIACIRKYLERRGVKFRYVWVAELQKRGAVHYHLLIWLPRGLSLPKPDRRGWWGWGSTRIEWARNAVGYIAKYAGKSDAAADLPKGLRIMAQGGLSKGSKQEKRWWLSPVWLRKEFSIDDDMVPAVGGGYVSRRTGETASSPWLFALVDGVPSIIPKGLFA